MSAIGNASKARRLMPVFVNHVIAACLVLLLVVSIGAAEADAQDLKRVFGKTKGAFVLYDLKNNRYIRHNESRCRQRFTPASTFKIPNSLIGLETGVVRDADFVIRWDRQRYPNEGRPAIAPFIHWWQDHTLRSAMKYSAVWYYIEIAQQVGAHRMEKYVTQFRYGNGDTSGGIDQFWRNSSLQISADEQVDFLRRFYTGQMSVSSRFNRDCERHHPVGTDRNLQTQRQDRCGAVS